MRLRNLTFCLLFVLALQARAWAAVVVTFDVPTTTIQVTGGTSGAPATWEDVYQADVAGGWGVVERVAQDAMYRTTASLNIGDGSTATHFTSLNEMVYFEDGYGFKPTAAATLQLGEKSGDWGINGSTWRTNTAGIIARYTGSTLLIYGSTLRTGGGTLAYDYATLEVLNSIISTVGDADVALASSDATSVVLKKVYVSGCQALLAKDGATVEDLHIHASETNVGLYCTGNATISGINVTGAPTYEYRAWDNTLTLVDPDTSGTSVLIGHADGVIIEQYTVNIHVNDKDGANLATATVACTSFGNIVSNDAGATFFRCIVDHTAGTFATDVSAGKWELTTAANAALAGVTGAAQKGAWVTGIAYVAAAQQFSVATDANGDIAEQTVDYKKWIGTSEVLMSYSPHTFTVTKAGHPTSTWENVTIDAPIQQTIKMIGGVIVIDD